MIFNFNISKYGRGIKGFTLLELLIYMAILSGVVVMVSGSFVSLTKGRAKSQAKSEVNSSIRFSSERIKQDIKKASSITSPLSGATSTSLSMVVSGVTVTYTYSNGNILRTEGVSPSTPINSSSVFASAPIFSTKSNYNSVSLATTTSVIIELNYNHMASTSDWKYDSSLRTAVTTR